MKKGPNKLYKVIKRIFEFILSIVLLFILILPTIIVAIAIKLEDGGPVFYKQKRIGKDLKTFDMYKFRSMKTNRKELDGKVSHKEMITKVGEFIRKTGIDELPQIINILKGEMSFIGPRPWIPEYYEWLTDEQKKRNDVLPGITGLAQAKGRNDISIFEKIEYDLEYIDNFGLIMDIKVIGLTIKEMLSKSGKDISEVEIKSEIEELKKSNKK